MNTDTATQTVTAELAPIGVLLWPTRDDAKYGDNFTLETVEIVRNEVRTFVRWTYRSGTTRYFEMGEQIAVRI